MAFTFVEIEEHKTRKLAALFAALIALYAVSILALVWGARLLLGFSAETSFPNLLGVLALALAAAILHWLCSTPHLVDRVLATILAKPLDADDTYHRQFQNIVEEVTVATGGRHQIEPFVIATPAMNACAMTDFSGRAALAVTEGILARLNRAQLEAVVGHEAAHIASGDSMVNSVFCGLFGLHEEALKRLSGVFAGRSGVEVIRGRAGVLILFVMAILWITNTMKRFCELLVSRAQEYRADAVAVRLTRNPLALAEALHLISTHWRGVGAQGESLSTIFILDPGEEYLSEADGLAAEWFSTHPPTARRIELLLGMTHIAPEAFDQAMADRVRRQRPRRLFREPGESPTPTDPTWFFRMDDEWKGPVALEEILQLPELTPDSWIRRDGESTAKPAHRDPHILAGLRRRYGHGDGPSRAPSINDCPNCRIPLRRDSYEGVPLDRCPACRGCYVTPDKMSRVLAREEYAFPESVKRLAKAIPGLRSRTRAVKRFGSRPYERLKERQCPQCGAAVVRKFYTEAYLVEVEQCWVCGLTWLDKHELELLQYLYEHRTDETPTAFDPTPK